MNGINHLIELCVGWMLHAGWQVAVVALIVFVFLKLGRNRINSQLRYALLLIVLLKFATPPFMPFSSGMFSQAVITDLGIDSSMDGRFEFSPVEPATLLPAYKKADDQVSPAIDVSQTDASSQNFPANLPPAGQARNQDVATVSTDTHWLSWLTWCYLAGVVVCSFRIVLGYRRIRRTVRGAELQYGRGTLCRVVSEITTKLEMRFAPELRLSDEVDAPFATGAFNPVIVLPRDLTQLLSSEQLEIVIAHELVHIRRRDLIVGWIEVLLATIWWFHPAMWWLGRSLRQTREDCCDDVLLANQLAKPEQYCETIIRAATYQSRPSFEPVALGFSNPQHPAGRRIKRLMDDSIFRSDRIRLPAICLTILLALAVLPGMRQAPAPQKATTEDGNQLKAEAANEQTPSPEFKNLKRVVGKIEGSSGEPIEDAAVKVSLFSHLEDGTYKKLRSYEVKSGKDGRFEVQCDQVVPPNRQLQLSVQASSDLHIRNQVLRSEIENSDFDIGILKLKRGMRITGRVVAPVKNSQQPIDPIVQISKIESTGEESDNSFFCTSLACDADGTFELMVPESCRLLLTLAAENYAPAFEHRTVNGKSVSDNKEIETLDLGDFKLRTGVSIVGTAKKRDGTHVAGAVVVIIQFESDSLGADDFLISSTKTDQKGKFRLPPHVGRCLVSVVEHASTRKIVNGICQGLNADGVVPLFDFVEVNLEGKTGEHELNLVEAESVAIRGVTRLEDGTPLAGAKVVYGYNLSGEPLNTGVVYSDKQGKYEFAIPKGRIPLLQLRDHRIGDGRYAAFVSDAALADNGQIFSKVDGARNDQLTYNKLTEEVANLDWIYRRDDLARRPSLLERAGYYARWWFLGE